MVQKYRRIISLIMANKKSELKYEYVDYIQGDGNQYIDTRINPEDNNFKVTLDVMLTQPTNNKTLGIWGNIIFNPSVTKNSIGIVGDNWFCGQGGTTSLGKPTIGLRTNLIFDMINAQFTVNNETSNVERLGGNLASAFLFARNDGYGKPYVGNNFVGRIYSCIFETSKGGIIQHLRPVRLINTNEYCMRCELTGRFFKNLGIGVFNGPKTIDEEIEYIESTDGLPYINTQYIPRRNSGKTRIITSTSSTEGTMGLYGYIDRDGDIENRITIGCNYNDGNYKWFAGSGSTVHLNNVIIDEKVEFIWDRKNKTINVNGIEYPCSDLSMNEENLTAYLFNRNNNNKPDVPYNFIGKVYLYQELTDFDEIIIDCVPTIYNGNYCLKDKLTSSYYYNVGEGMFTGPESKIDYILTEYTEATGQQWFDLGVKGDNTDETEVKFKTDNTVGGFIFGARDEYLVNTQASYANISGSNTLVYSGFNDKWLSRTITNSLTDGWMYVKQNTNNVEINGKTYSSVNTKNFTTIDNLMVGRILQDERAFKGYLNILKIKKNGELIFDLHSAIQISSGIAGFWCFVTNKFYSSETDINFIAGPELNDFNKTELNNYIEYSNQLTQINYTSESWGLFDINKNNAIKISEDGQSQSEIDKASNDLLISMQNLVEITPLIPDYEINNLVLNGTNYEDTGIKLFDELKDFTLFIEFDISHDNYNSRTQKVLFHCMNEISPWYGITCQTTTNPTTTNGGYGVSYNTFKTVVYNPILINNSNILTKRGLMCIRNTKVSDTSVKLPITTFDIYTKRYVDDIKSSDMTYEDIEDLRSSRLILGAADMLDDGGITRNTIGNIYKFEYFNNYLLTDEQLLLKFLKQI